MKKLLLLACLVASTFSVKVMADNAQLFQLDQKSISDKFQGLNNLENFVNQHDGVTLTEMQANHNELLKEMDTNSANSIVSVLGAFKDTPLGIPSFVWGLCFGVAGIAIVYFVTDSKDEAMSALWGCVVGSVVGVVIYVLWVFVFFASAATTYGGI